MTDIDKLSEWLAIHVMGWSKRREYGDTRFWWVDESDSIKATVNEKHGLHDLWSPPTDIEQAMMCLEKSGWWNLSKDEITGDFSCEVAIDDQFQTLEIASTIPMAISLACARAAGWDG